MLLGIDPGKKGALCFMDELSGNIVSYGQMVPVHSFPDLSCVKKCFIEKCQSRPGQSVQAMFNYGVHFGEILGFLAANKIPHVMVNPRRWQSKMLGKFPKSESKKAALNTAKRLWPSESFILQGSKVPHNGVIDACLIAEYGRLFG